MTSTYRRLGRCRMSEPVAVALGTRLDQAAAALSTYEARTNKGCDRVAAPGRGRGPRRAGRARVSERSCPICGTSLEGRQATGATRAGHRDTEVVGCSGTRARTPARRADPEIAASRTDLGC